MKTLFLIISILLIQNISLSQDTLNEEQKSHKANYFKKLQELKFHKDPEYYYDKKVNLLKIKKLKSLGVDLYQIDNMVGWCDYKGAVLFSDVILYGTVIEKEYDSTKQVFWHTTYTVSVDTVLKGRHISGKVKIKLVTGEIGNGFVNSSSEPWEINLGEKMLFYLNYFPYERLEASKAKGLFKFKINADKYDKNIFTVYKVLNEKSGDFYEVKQKLKSKREVFKEIKRINKVNDPEDFYSIDFY